MCVYNDEENLEKIEELTGERGLTPFLGTWIYTSPPAEVLVVRYLREISIWHPQYCENPCVFFSSGMRSFLWGRHVFRRLLWVLGDVNRFFFADGFVYTFYRNTLRLTLLGRCTVNISVTYLKQKKEIINVKEYIRTYIFCSINIFQRTERELRNIFQL